VCHLLVTKQAEDLVLEGAFGQLGPLWIHAHLLIRKQAKDLVLEGAFGQMGFLSIHAQKK
jgi:hypothetical protein